MNPSLGRIGFWSSVLNVINIRGAYKSLLLYFILYSWSTYVTRPEFLVIVVVVVISIVAFYKIKSIFFFFRNTIRKTDNKSSIYYLRAGYDHKDSAR